MRSLLSALALFAVAAFAPAAEPAKLKVLYLGDAGHHQPKARFDQLEPVLLKRGIALTYTDSVDDLNAKKLNEYDGLMIFANHTKAKPEQIQALMDYVASGKGFIPLHCASYCFIDNADYIDLVGAQFRSHTTGVFRTKLTKAEHPILEGYSPFESWDETYTHHKHNEKNRTVLEVRTDRQSEEPWTWVRTHGKGRVFYTAWGHDQRTWSHEGFHTLVERGTRWACGQDLKGVSTYVDSPKMTKVTGEKSDFEFMPAKVPFYPPGERWGTMAEPISKMQKPLTPEKSIKHYSVPEGFELKMFASEKDFGGGKPIAMTWDERGRLWVSVTTDYPNEMKKEGEGRDKILILEDTDGDGVADKTTLFADKLSIPTSLLCVRGGVVVTQAPHMLFLKDTDGDDKADVREVLFTGWATNDTHAGPSNLRYGFDNWIYGMVGYAGYNGTVNGEKHNFRQGFFRFKLNEKDGKRIVEKLEFIRSVNNNAWGVGFNEQGDLYGSTANGCPLVYCPIPNRYYEKVRGLTPTVLPNIALDNRFHPITENVRQVDWHKGFTAAAGCSIYTARAYPPEYWNRTAFVTEPTGHLTAAFVIQDNGTEPVAHYGWNLVASDDEWAAPIDAQVGPDGMVWVLDWYNYIVQHNPTPQGYKTGAGNAYESELRDKKYGRVYKVVYTKAKVEKQPNLKDAKTDSLVETLKNDNMFWRLQAQRLLVERGAKDTMEKLAFTINFPAENPLAAVHALWAADGLGGYIPPKETKLLFSEAAISPNTPLPVLIAIGRTKSSEHLDNLVARHRMQQSASPSARMHSYLAMSDLPRDSRSGAALSHSLQDEKNFHDRNVQDALLIAMTVHAPDTIKEVCVQGPKLSTAAQALLQRAVTSYASTAPNEGLGALLVSLTQAKNPDLAQSILTGLANGWPANKAVTLDAEGEKAFATLLTKAPATSRGKLLRLSATWGVKGLEAELAELSKGFLTSAADEKLSDLSRVDAAKQAMEFLPSDETAAAKLVAILDSKASPELASGILDALSQSRAKNLGPALVAKVGSLPATVRPSAMRIILARPEPTKAFLDAVEKGTLRFDALALDQKTALAAHPDSAIAERAKKLLALGGGLPNADRQKVIEEYTDLVKKTGDVGLGKKSFTTHCAKCHKHSGEGQQIGPDLTGFAVHPKEEILIHLLDPSRSVEGNYKAYTAKLLDGRIVTGLLSSQTKTGVELLDAENKKQSFAMADIDEFIESKKSLMPEGFEKQMTREELSNVLEFMTLKGKYVPIPFDKYATAITTKGMFFEDDGVGERLVFRDWKPKEFEKVPFLLTDPNGDKQKNAILLYGPNGKKAPLMPKSVTLPCNTSAKAIHFLSGIGGWCAPYSTSKEVCVTVRLNYADGKTEDHDWKNGVHFADYIGRANVPESKFAFGMTGGQQVRYLAIQPKRTDTVIKTIELIKGPHESAPIILSATIETP